MNEININSLASDYQVINIKDADGNVLKQIKFKKLSMARTFDIADKYNNLFRSMTPIIMAARDKMSDIQKKEYDSKTFEQQAEYILFQNMSLSKKWTMNLINICLEIITPAKFGERLKYKYSKDYVSKKWIMNNLTAEQVKQFTDIVLAPILGEKKKTEMKIKG